MSDELVVVKKDDPADSLTVKERQALDDYRRRNQPPMSPATAVNFFQLYVEGYTLEQMLQTNRSWGLGAIADACVRYDWPAKRSAYVDDAHKQAVQRLAKLKTEAINYLSDLAVVAHTEFRQEMMAYIQNPKEENLPKGRLKTFRDYKRLLETIEILSNIGKTESPPPPEPSSPINVNVAAGGQVAIVSDKGSGILEKLANEARRGISGSKD